jgi:hypothetical protein
MTMLVVDPLEVVQVHHEDRDVPTSERCPLDRRIGGRSPGLGVEQPRLGIAVGAQAQRSQPAQALQHERHGQRQRQQREVAGQHDGQQPSQAQQGQLHSRRAGLTPRLPPGHVRV